MGVRQIADTKQRCLHKLQNMPDDAKKYRSARLATDKILWRMISPFIERCEKLTGWMVTGLAAAVVLAIANAASPKSAFPYTNIKLSVWLLIGALFLYFVQRMIGDANLAHSEASKELETLTNELAVKRPSLDEIAEISARLICAHPPPWSAITEKAIFKAIEGDWDYGARRAMHLTMITAPIFILGILFCTGIGLLALVGLWR